MTAPTPHCNDTNISMARERFDEIMAEKKSFKKGKNTVSLTKLEYEPTGQKLRDISAGNIKPSGNDHYTMKRLTLIDCKVQGKLVSRIFKAGTMLKYLCEEELFDEIHQLHIEKGHGGRDILKAATKEKYANVTQEALMTYLRKFRSFKLIY